MENNILKTQMIDYIAEENKAFLNLQQIDDPEMTLNERKNYLQNTLEHSHSKFLMKFGRYMKLEHTEYFSNPQNNTSDEQYAIEFYLNLIKRNNMVDKDVTVKNRRYEAMLELNKGKYFSDIEMMKREPLLYHEFVGQYLTKREIQIRDEKNTKTFLNIIFATIDKNAANVLKAKQEREISRQQDDKSDECETDDGNNLNHNSAKSPPLLKKLWGEFDDNLLGQQHSNLHCNREISSITNEERNFLRDEFINIMQSKFVSGSDEDFDYSTVDLNQNYDNEEIMSKDDEDKYFDSEDASESIDLISLSENTNEEVDELDIFMQTLNKSLK